MKRLFFILLLLTPASGYGQWAKLTGKVALDTGWARKFYVCRIPGFDYMFTISHAMIIAEGGIDTAGNFSVNLPATNEECLYRLHFIKKGDPASTLIIGSQDANHVFFIAKQGDQINFTKAPGVAISQAGIGGSKANSSLNALLRLAANDTTGNNSFISFADTCTSPLVGLLAISRTYKPTGSQKDKVAGIIARYDAQNAYGTHIFQEYRRSNYWVLYMAVGVLMAAAMCLYVYRFYKQHTAQRIWRQLSQREQDIVGLILSGKSNKEVALALSIELSTVKTHVNNIYAKLKVSDRKDLGRYKVFVNAQPAK